MPAAEADQALCFLSGANSIFTGDTLLTTRNNEKSADDKMFEQLGLVGARAAPPAMPPAHAFRFTASPLYITTVYDHCI